MRALEIVHLHAGEPNFVFFFHLRNEFDREFGYLRAVVGRMLQRGTPRDERETPLPQRPRQFQLQRHGARTDIVIAKPPSDRLAMRDQHAAQLQPVQIQIVLEGVFLAI